MIKFLAGLFFAIGSAMLGLSLRKYFKQRHCIYRDLWEFSTMAKQNIEFLKTPIPSIVKEFGRDKKSKVARLLESYFLDNEKDKNTLKELKKVENKDLELFLGMLGKYSQKEQIAEISKYEAKFQSLEVKTAEEEKRLGNMYFKLCVLLGIALLVIVV